MSHRDRQDDGQQSVLSEDLDRVRREATARHAREQAQPVPALDQPLGPTWVWAAALLGQGMIAGLCTWLLVLGPPWTCERAVGGGVLVLAGGPGLFAGVFAALVLEGLVVRVEELLEFRRFTERIPGVVTRAEHVEKQLSQGGYSRHAEFEVEYEASGRGRRLTERPDTYSARRMKKLVRMLPPGTVVDVCYRPGHPAEPRIFGPGRREPYRLVARAVFVMFTGGLFGGALFAFAVLILGR